jgi:hypothetical protein
VLYTYNHDKKRSPSLIKLQLEGSNGNNLTLTEDHLIVVKKGDMLIDKPASSASIGDLFI